MQALPVTVRTNNISNLGQVPGTRGKIGYARAVCFSGLTGQVETPPLVYELASLPKEPPEMGWGRFIWENIRVFRHLLKGNLGAYMWEQDELFDAGYFARRHRKVKTLAGSPDVEKRLAAVKETLYLYTNTQERVQKQADLLEQLARDPEVRVRKAVADRISTIHMFDAIRYKAHNILLNDSDPEIKKQAIQAIGYIRDARLVESTWNRVLQESDPQYKRQLFKAIPGLIYAEFLTPGRILKLVTALCQDPHPEVQQAIPEELGPIVDELQDPSNYHYVFGREDYHQFMVLLARLIELVEKHNSDDPDRSAD